MQHIGPEWGGKAGYAAQNAVYFAETSPNRLIRLNILHFIQDILIIEPKCFNMLQ